MKLSRLWAVIQIACIALLFDYSANARVTTFAWDAETSWPAGTTIELEANGATASGITTNQYTLDVPVQPGEIIHARARAIPPDGYQCGEPLALCPPSEWTNLVQTIPEIPSGLWAWWQKTGGVLIMSRPTIDTSNLTVSTGTVAARTFSHTVPSGTNLLIVVLQGWVVGESNADGSPPSGITWNGTSLTRITLTGGAWGENQHGIWYLASPTATTANIVISGGDSSIIDGGVIKAINFSNVDTTVGTSGIRSITNTFADSLTTITLAPTTTNNDLIVSYWSQQLSTATTGQTYGGTSGTQTIQSSTAFNLDSVFLTTSSPTSSGQNVTFLPSSSANYPSGISFSIAGISSGNASASITGSSGTGHIGEPTVSGSSLKSISGNSGTGSSGTVSVSGAALQAILGNSLSANTGNLSLSSTALKTITGTSITGSSGAPNLYGSALQNITGTASTGAIGTVSLAGGGSVTITGTAGTGSIGLLTFSTYANYTLPGIFATAAVGSVVASADGNVNINVPGVGATGNAGSMTITGGGNKAIAGNSGSSGIGSIVIGGGANQSLSGLGSTSGAGILLTSAGANKAISGVYVTSGAGSPALIGTANKALTGVGGTSSIGSPTIGGGAGVALSGASMIGATGTQTLTASALKSLLGVYSVGDSGIITLAAGASLSLSGISANGQIGTLIISAGNNATISLSGDAAVGSVGSIVATGDGLVLLEGVSATGYAGALRLAEIITPAGRLLLIQADDRVLVIPADERFLVVQGNNSLN